MKVVVLPENTMIRKRNLGTVGLEVAVLIGSALIYSMAFPGFISAEGIGFIALFALIPVFAVIKNAGFAACAGYGFIFGFAFYLFFNYWLSTFHALAIILVPFIKASEMLLLFIALKLCSRWLGRKAYIAQAICWTAYAYLSQSWFAGYPYGAIAYALYKYRVLIQIADFSGIWLLTFLMVLPQAFMGSWLCDRYRGVDTGFKQHIRSERIPLLCYAAILAFSIIYGIVTISYWNRQEPDIVWRIAAIQHNADSWKGGYPTYKRNFNNLRKMTYEALLEKPDMVIWSETAFVPSVAWHTQYPSSDDHYDTAGLVDEFVEFGKSLPVPLLTGNPEGVVKEGESPYNEDGSWNRKDYNTVIFFEGGEIKQTYRKQHLVPFTEHFPYEKQLPWLYNLLLANDYNWWEKGTESVVFETAQGVRFSTPICFEDVFGYLNADFVKSGADLILNMTNDSWSGAVSAEMQHAAIAVFRSVENRKTTLRATNSGISCMINPTGKIEDPMTPFKMYWHIYNVPVYTDGAFTIYTKHGDYLAHAFVWVSYAIIAFCLLMAAHSTATNRKVKKKNEV